MRFFPIHKGAAIIIVRQGDMVSLYLRERPSENRQGDGQATPLCWPPLVRILNKGVHTEAEDLHNIIPRVVYKPHFTELRAELKYGNSYFIRQIYYPNAPVASVISRKGCTTAFSGQGTNASRAVICHVTIAGEHTVWGVVFSHIDYFVRMAFDLFVGHQCAFRFLLMGVSPATGAFLREAGSSSDTPAQATLTEIEPAYHKDKIYTHDEAALIVEMFEGILDAHSIKIPFLEDDERETDNETKLYGSAYSGLLDMVETSIIDLLSRSKRGAAVAENVFSGNA